MANDRAKNRKILMEEKYGNMTLITYRQHGYTQFEVVNSKTGKSIIPPRQGIYALKITDKLFGLYYDGKYSFYLIGKIDKEHINVKNWNMLIQA